MKKKYRLNQKTLYGIIRESVEKILRNDNPSYGAIHRNIKRILKEGKGRKPSKAYHIATFGDQKNDARKVNWLYDQFKNHEITVDEIIKMIFDVLYINRDKITTENKSKRRVEGDFWGYDDDKRFFLTNGPDYCTLHIWTNDEPQALGMVDKWWNERNKPDNNEWDRFYY